MPGYELSISNGSQLNQWKDFPVSPSRDQSHFFSCGTFVASGNSFLFHFLFSLYDQLAGEAEHQRRCTTPRHELEKKCLLTSHAVYAGAFKCSRSAFSSGIYGDAVRPLAAWFLGMRSVAEQRKLAEDAWASGSECSYTLDLTAVTNICIS